MNPEYQAIQQALQPRSTLLRPEDLEELACPHTPVEELDWPFQTPRTSSDVERIITQLEETSPVAAMICAITAVEMTVPPENTAEGQFLRRYLQTAWRGLEAGLGTWKSREEFHQIETDPPRRGRAVRDEWDRWHILRGWRVARALVSYGAPPMSESQGMGFAAYLYSAVLLSALVAVEERLGPDPFPDEEDIETFAQAERHRRYWEARRPIEVEWLARWWRLCRCRLANFEAIRGFTVEGRRKSATIRWVSARSSKKSVKYQTIQKALTARPRHWSHTPLADLERRCKDVPEDSEWPPQIIIGDVVSEVQRHIQPMSEGAQLLCALTALEMIIPTWEAEASTRWPAWVNTIRSVGDHIWAWQQGQASGEDIRTWNRRLDQLWSHVESTLHTSAAEDGATWAVRAAWRITRGITQGQLSTYCAFAIWTVGVGLGRVAGLDVEQRIVYLREVFLPRWWRLCRCRLAFADASTAEVSGPNARRPRIGEDPRPPSATS